MLMVRLKQCECALSDGLLDEAYDLAVQPDLRGHRRGQHLIEKLVKAFVERGRQHLAAGRLLQASIDSEKAGRLGGNLGTVAQLRMAIKNALQSEDRANQEFGKVLGDARRNMDQGQLSVAEKMLAAIDTSDARVDGFKQDIAGRRLAIEAGLKKASEALAAGNWEAAIDFIAPLRRGCTQDAGLRKLCGEIRDHLARETIAAFEAGRLNVVAGLLAGLDRLPIQSVDTDNLRATLNQCRMAYAAIENGQPHDAEAVLRRLCSLWPKATWLAAAADRTKELGAALSVIRSSPLSLVAMASDRTNQTSPTTSPAVAAPPHIPQPNVMTPGSFCLHVDGIGSFQVFTSSSITIGPIGSSRAVDVPLMLDVGVPVVTISRSDEDYFLKAARPVVVNDQQAVNKLLNSGDRIGLGSRCRVTFRRPSAASTTAVLDLSGTRLSNSNVRTVLLMDREIIIGPGSSAHIRADDLPAPLVLQRRGDGLFCRSTTEMTVNEKPVGLAAEVPLGAHVSVGSLRFVVVREQRT